MSDESVHEKARQPEFGRLWRDVFEEAVASWPRPIPVSERMPEQGVPVLARGYFVHSDFRKPENVPSWAEAVLTPPKCDTDCWHWKSHHDQQGVVFYMWDVTHWLPLPMAPE